MGSFIKALSVLRDPRGDKKMVFSSPELEMKSMPADKAYAERGKRDGKETHGNMKARDNANISVPKMKKSDLVKVVHDSPHIIFIEIAEAFI